MGFQGIGKSTAMTSLDDFHIVIAVSFHRLFLGGLLPSRACLRFAGSLPIPRNRLSPIHPVHFVTHPSAGQVRGRDRGLGAPSPRPSPRRGEGVAPMV